MEKKDAVCAVCKRLRIKGEWRKEKATEEDYKILGRQICPDCGPKTEG